MSRKLTLAIAVAALAATVAVTAYGSKTTTASKPQFVVVVAGTVVGSVADESEVRQLVAAMQSKLTKEAQALVSLDQKVQLRPLSVSELKTVKPADDRALRGALAALVPQMANGYAITVDGRDVVAVTDQQAAEAVMLQLKDDYKQNFLQGAVSVDMIKFDEVLGIRPKLVPVQNVHTPEQAKDILRRGTDRVLLYTVQRGDTLWDIARTRNMSIEEIQKANPGVDPDVIQEGQALSLVVAQPFIHLSSVETVTYTEEIPFPVEAQEDPDLWPFQERVITEGVPGKRQVTVRIERHDGEEQRREVLGTQVSAKPRTQVVARGTKQAPEKGTGSFLWPVKGEITSYFGPRWGSFHPGVDIAAREGTPVKATDGGTVVFVGWYGNYGQAILIDHGNGKLITLYGHLSDYNVSEGDTVQKGDVIGYVGNTGYSTGAHLHFEVRVKGSAVDPLSFYE